MARPLRLEFPGAVYHLTSRGNARQKIFLTDADRELFLQEVVVVRPAARPTPDGKFMPFEVMGSC